LKCNFTHNVKKLDMEQYEQDYGRRSLGVLFFQICEVGGLTIIHKRTYPNLATGQRGE
jgi:hypothetical protein